MSTRPTTLTLALLATFFVGLSQSNAADGEPKRIVMVANRASMTSNEQIFGAVQGQLSDLPVILEIAWIDNMSTELRTQIKQARTVVKDRNAISVFWADLSTPDQVFLFFSQPAGERILVRDIGQSSASTEGRLETLAVIVRASVKAILEGGNIGIGRDVSPENEFYEPTGLLDFAVSYSFAPHSGGRKWIHGPCLNLNLTLDEWARIFIGYRMMFPIQHHYEDLVTLELNSHIFEAGFAARWQWNALRLEIGARFILDFLTAKAISPAENVLPQHPENKWLPGLSPSISIGWTLNPFVSLFFSASLDIIFNQPDYVLETKTGYRTVVAPWTARPFLQMGLAFPIL